MIYTAKELNSHLKHLTLTATEDCSECDHICSGNCRREGCNCECGEFHEAKKPYAEFIGTTAQWNKVKTELGRPTFEELSVADLDISPDGNYNIA